MRFKDMPIRRKLMTALLFTSCAVLLLTCTAFVAYEFISLHRNMLQSYMTRAQILAANLTAALAFTDPADATQVLGALQLDRRMTEACVYDDHGKIFAAYPAGAPANLFPPQPGESGYHGGHLDIFCPIVQGDRKLGVIYIQSNLSALTDRYQAYAWLSGAIIAGSVLLAYLLSNLLQKQISIPILSLAGTALTVSHQRDFSIRARKFGEDELGSLTDAFNRMLSEIEAQNQALRRSEERFRALIENNQDGIAVSNSQGEAIYVSPALTRILGRPESDFIGKSRQDLVHPEDLPIVRDKMAETLQNPGKIIRARYRLRHQDGSWRWVDMMATNLIDNPAIGGIIRNIRDVTEQLKLEEINRLGESKAIATIEDCAILMMDPEGKILTWNRGAELIKGYSAEEIIGKNVELFYPPEEAKGGKPRRLLKEAAAKGQVEDEGERVRKDGSRFLADVVITALKDDQGQLKGFIKVTRDVTEQRRQEELKSYTRALEVSNREMQDFVFVASHDLQEPLRKVQSFGEFLAEEYGNVLEGNGKDYLERMRSAAGRMQTLINDLLTLTRVTTKAKPFEPVELSQVLQDVLSDLEVRVAEKKARIEVGPLPRIEADATQMRQLFQNLVGNALKFQRPGVPPEIRVEAEQPPGSTQCLIRVKDNGIGFDNKYAEQIFKVFERLHGRDEYEGTGIGLAVCRKVVERHGGTITAQGTPGQGSVFTVALPVRQNSKGGKT